MKLSDAICIGKECGLNTPEEAINNILIHYHQFMTEDKYEEEIDELITEAEMTAGIEFHNIPGCSLAMISGRCYICDKLSKL